MDIKELSIELLNIEKAITQVLIALHPKEVLYQEKYHKYLLDSPMLEAGKREAEAMEKLRQEPIFLEYKNLQLDYRILRSKKETLLEVCKNLRTYNV